MTDVEKLRAFVRGYWENADHETRRGEPDVYIGDEGKASLDDLADYWYERGIKDLAEMVLGKLGETK